MDQNQRYVYLLAAQATVVTHQLRSGVTWQTVDDYVVIFHNKRVVPGSVGKFWLRVPQSVQVFVHQILAYVQLCYSRQILFDIIFELGPPVVAYITVCKARFTAQWNLQTGFQLRMVRQVYALLWRCIDKAMVGGYQQGGVAASQLIYKLFESFIQFKEV